MRFLALFQSTYGHQSLLFTLTTLTAQLVHPWATLSVALTGRKDCVEELQRAINGVQAFE
jgi:hypothetical protein